MIPATKQKDTERIKKTFVITRRMSAKNKSDKTEYSNIWECVSVNDIKGTRKLKFKVDSRIKNKVIENRSKFNCTRYHVSGSLR